MKCTACGHEFPNGKFCPVCGTPVAESTNTQSCLGNFEEQPVTAATYTYTNPDPTPTYKPEAPITPVMPAKRKTGKIIAAILALVLVVGAVVGVMALFGGGPADSIGKGAMKVLKSETFNFDVTISEGEFSITMTGTVEFVPEEGILNFYMEGYNKAIDSKITVGMYDYCAFSIEEEGGDKWYSYQEFDEDSLEEFFEYYLEYSDSDLNKKKDVLLILEEIDDLSDGELSEVVDLEILAECITEYVGAHNDKKWLEENAGFSQEKKNGVTYYTYEPDLYDFLEGSLPYFEEALEEEDYYDDTMDALDDSRSELNRINLEITFGVKSGYLTSVLMDVEGLEIEVTFSEFGKAGLDYDELEDLLSESEKGYEEQWSSYYD